jgi:hypothetical protein
MNENNNYTYQNLEYKNEKSIKNDDIITHSEREKIHPYRKYQIIILLLLILLFLFIYLISSLNTELTFLIKKNKNLNKQNSRKKRQIKFSNILSEVIEINYKLFYNLDKEPNIETIKTVSDYYMLTKFLREQIQGDEKNSRILFIMCYKATIDEDKASSFRKKCENLSPLIFVIETTDGFRFGGYTSSFLNNSRNSYINDPYSFIFSFDTKKKYKIIKNEEAVFDIKDNFPSFGRNDIVIKDGFLSNKSSYSMFPDHYEQDTEALGDYQLTGGVKFFQIKEMEVIIPWI